MENLSSLYYKFHEVLESSSSYDLESYKNPHLWELLNSSEKMELALLFLKKGEEVVSSSLFLDAKEKENEMVDLFSCAQKLAPEHGEVYYKQALSYFYFASNHKKWRYYLQALDKLVYLEMLDPAYFESNLDSWVLWGNIFLSLSQTLSNETYLTCACEKFEKAALLYAKKSIHDHRAQLLYWDYGCALARQGNHSGEGSDYYLSIKKFEIAEKLGCKLPHFYIEFAKNYFDLAKLTHEPHCLQKAQSLIEKAIITLSHSSKELPAAHNKAWFLYALIAKKKADLTGSIEDLENADKIFEQAIPQIPEYPDLWLIWGEMFLRFGWMKKAVSFIEIAIEKFTSLNSSECNPLSTALLLGESLTALGYFLDDYKVLKQGEERIIQIRESYPSNPQCFAACGMCDLSFAFYFEDEQYYKQAIVWFQKGVAADPHESVFWYGLFQAYFNYGLLAQSEHLMHQGIEAIAKLSALCPKNAFFYHLWGVALLKFNDHQLNKEEKIIHEAIEKLNYSLHLSSNEDVDTLYHLGICYDWLGEFTLDESYYQKAIEMLFKVKEAEPQATDVTYHLALALSHLGEVTFSTEYLSMGVELFEEVLSYEEDHDQTFCNLGYALLVLADLCREEASLLRDKSEKRLIQSTNLGNTEAYYYLACLYSLENNLSLSLKYLQKAYESNQLPPLDELLEDTWLENVSSTKDFQDFIKMIQQ